jgi:phospholipid/cholesterol/gamma-HCH transport system substrate-binding protein
MEKSSNKRAVMVGVFVFLGLVFLVAGVLTVGNLHETFVKKMKVITLFDDVSGLQAGNNIWFSGVKVGMVNKVEFYGKQVKVTMKIEEKAQQYIRKDAKVKIATDGLIGNRIIVIYGGTGLVPQVEEGDTLEVEKTLSTEDMMNTFQENNKNFLEITSDFKTITKKIASGEGNIGKLLNDETIYNSMAITTAALQKASVDAGRLVASLSAYTSGMHRKGTLAHELVNDTTVFRSMRESAERLQQISDQASLLVAELNKAAKNPRSPLGVLLHDDASGSSLKATIKNLESTSAKLNKNMEALQSSFLLRKGIKKQEKAEKKAKGTSK